LQQTKIEPETAVPLWDNLMFASDALEMAKTLTFLAYLIVGSDSFRGTFVSSATQTMSIMTAQVINSRQLLSAPAHLQFWGSWFTSTRR
jgi:hypothetical protein